MPRSSDSDASGTSASGTSASGTSASSTTKGGSSRAASSTMCSTPLSSQSCLSSGAAPDDDTKFDQEAALSVFEAKLKGLDMESGMRERLVNMQRTELARRAERMRVEAHREKILSQHSQHRILSKESATATAADVSTTQSATASLRITDDVFPVSRTTHGHTTYRTDVLRDEKRRKKAAEEAALKQRKAEVLATGPRSDLVKQEKDKDKLERHRTQVLEQKAPSSKYVGETKKTGLLARLKRKDKPSKGDSGKGDRNKESGSELDKKSLLNKIVGRKERRSDARVQAAHKETAQRQRDSDKEQRDKSGSARSASASAPQCAAVEEDDEPITEDEPVCTLEELVDAAQRGLLATAHQQPAPQWDAYAPIGTLTSAARTDYFDEERVTLHTLLSWAYTAKEAGQAAGPVLNKLGDRRAPPATAAKTSGTATTAAGAVGGDKHVKFTHTVTGIKYLTDSDSGQTERIVEELQCAPQQPQAQPQAAGSSQGQGQGQSARL